MSSTSCWTSAIKCWNSSVSLRIRHPPLHHRLLFVVRRVVGPLVARHCWLVTSSAMLLCVRLLRSAFGRLDSRCGFKPRDKGGSDWHTSLEGCTVEEVLGVGVSSVY